MFLRPDYNLENIYKINFDELKSQGIKCLMFDLDSTVMVSKSGRFTKATLDWFDSFIKDFEVAIISNNKSEEYIEKVVQIAPCKVIGWANKPNPEIMGEYLKSVNIVAMFSKKPADRLFIINFPFISIFIFIVRTA